MRDYALLAKSFRHCAEKRECASCPMYVKERKCPDFEVRKLAADAIEELLAAVPHWISVEERLPENDGCYIVAVKNDHKRRYSKTAYFSKANWFAKQDVTHWMPLPEPPKEEFNKNVE